MNETPDAPGNAVRELYAALWRFAEGARGQLLGATALLTASQLVKLTLPYLAGQATSCSAATCAAPGAGSPR